MARFALLAIVCVSFVVSAQSLKCYNCVGLPSDSCSEETVCGKSADPNNMSVCMKRVYKEGTVQKVKRGCAFSRAPTFDKALECRDNEDVSCDICKEDLCNSAPAVKYSIYSALAVFVALLFNRY